MSASCADRLLALFKQYEQEPHILFNRSEFAHECAIATCLGDKTIPYLHNRTEYLEKVQKYGYNDYILREYKKKQQDILYSEASYFTRLQMMLG